MSTTIDGDAVQAELSETVGTTVEPGDTDSSGSPDPGDDEVGLTGGEAGQWVVEEVLDRDMRVETLDGYSPSAEIEFDSEQLSRVDELQATVMDDSLGKTARVSSVLRFQSLVANLWLKLIAELLIDQLVRDLPLRCGDREARFMSSACAKRIRFLCEAVSDAYETGESDFDDAECEPDLRDDLHMAIEEELSAMPAHLIEEHILQAIFVGERAADKQDRDALTLLLGRYHTVLKRRIAALEEPHQDECQRDATLVDHLLSDDSIKQMVAATGWMKETFTQRLRLARS